MLFKISSLLGILCNGLEITETFREFVIGKVHSNASVVVNIENTDAFTTFHSRLKIAGAIDEQREQYWKSLLEHAGSVINFIAKRGLAFRCDQELIGSPGNRNYFGALEFIVQYDIFLAQHCQNHSN